MKNPLNGTVLFLHSIRHLIYFLMAKRGVQTINYRNHGDHRGNYNAYVKHHPCLYMLVLFLA